MEIPSLMKAAIHRTYGPPSVLHVEDTDKPIPGEGEILIKMKASTVNRTDCARLRAKPFIMRFFTGLFRPKKPIPGTEFSGQIETIGSEASSWKVGDRVYGFNDAGLQTHAEYLCISETENIGVIPEGVSFEQAASMTEGAHYAWNMVNKVDIQPGQQVLVNGASGAIGSAAVQILRHLGANVVGVTSTKNLELVTELGADRVIDYEQEDFTRENQQYQFIFDTVGKSSFSACKPLLLSGGVYISSELGRMAQNLWYALITASSKGKRVIFPVPSDVKASMEVVRKMIADNHYQSVIDRNYPLAEIREAFEYVETGQKTGNVVVTC